MLFNSLEFGLFLPVVFVLYWFVFNRDLRHQNIFLLVASYFFYGWWDWRFLLLIFISSCTDFWVGRAMYSAPGRRKKLLLYISLAVNLGMLGFFKYYNFFVQSFVDAFTFFGSSMEASRLNIILPVGISFYTFQTLSYTLDIHKGRLKPTKDFIAFLGFVSFFPQLVAGPIERAINLLPQFERTRSFIASKATDGMRQMLWGLFKKVVIADNCAMYVDYVYENSSSASGSTLIAGAVVFMIQIYCDFSAYSDIAIGSARLFGFNLSLNFNFPLFAKSVQDFWRKWHITLTSWLRDYLVIPFNLRAKELSSLNTYLNTIFLFVIIGLWHGASWVYVLFGFLHGLLFFRSSFFKDFSLARNFGMNDSSYLVKLGRRIMTFILVTAASSVFPMSDPSQVSDFFFGILSPSVLSWPHKLSIWMVALILIFLLIEFKQRHKEHALELNLSRLTFLPRQLIYYTLIALIFLFKAPAIDFVYFQF